eukprot:12209-Heterococcus_DN1.PRE.4
MFFHTYASFEWSRQCVSIDGHKNIDELQKSSSSSSSSSGTKRTSSGAVHDTTATVQVLPTDLTDPLLSDELLSKYRDRCTKSKPTSQSANDNDTSSKQRSKNSSSKSSNSKDNTASTAAATATAFSVRPMNVMNPLNPSENLIGDVVNARRAHRVIHLIQITARNLQPVLLYVKREATKAQRGQQQRWHRIWQSTGSCRVHNVNAT